MNRREPSGPQFTIRQLCTVIAGVALGLALLRQALRSQAVVACSLWLLSPLILSPCFMFVPPPLMRTLFRVVTFIAFMITAMGMYVIVSAGGLTRLRLGELIALSLWLMLAFAYGYIASIVWSQRTHGRSM